MPIRSKIQRKPVANYCNHRTDYGRYFLWDAFDNDKRTKFPIRCNGYIVLPQMETAGTLAIGSSAVRQPILISASEDLKDWRALGEVIPGDEVKEIIDVPANVFVRIKLSKNLGSIDGIRYERTIPPVAAFEEAFVPGFRDHSAQPTDHRKSER